MEILSRIFTNDDWVTKGVTSSRITIAWHLLTPLTRIATALILSYLSAGLRSKPRLSSALVTATLSSFLTYAYLLPMMVHTSSGGRDMELSQVALLVLSFYAAL
eukprot:scaffold9811_cov78-Skeletonema_dohrnii-CCMP3373.AAC.1